MKQLALFLAALALLAVPALAGSELVYVIKPLKEAVRLARTPDQIRTALTEWLDREASSRMEAVAAPA